MPARDELLARAEALVPVLRQRSEACERLRRCPEETIAQFEEQGLLKLCQPARYGGYEVGWDLRSEVSEVLARGCGSQAWVQNIFTDHAHKLGTFTREAQDEVWSKDPKTRAAASFDPVGRARPVPGGVIFSGRHSFASGIDYAQWLICGGQIAQDDRPQRRCFFLIPKHDAVVIDDWQVMGLAGTGSKSFEVKEAFVPEHRILDGAAADEGTGPGARVNPAPLYRMPRHSVASSGFAAVAVGIAQGFLEDYLRYTGARKSRGVPVAALMGTQIGVGTAAAEIDAAHRIWLEAVREVFATLARGETVSERQKLRTKLSSAHACQLTLQAVQRLFNAAGGRALYEGNTMQRRFRDLHAVAAHISLGWDSATAAYGAHLLGIAGD